jgi:hypothetical protein
MTRIKAIIGRIVESSKKTARFFRKGSVEWRTPLGDLHREDGPAVEGDDGQKQWWVDGKLHRVGGPAVVTPWGDEQWCENGHTHRDDGPAVTSESHKSWYRHGRRHRVDGPAVETKDGRDEWWVNGRKLTEDEFYRYVDQETGEVLIPPGKKLSYEQK